MKSNASVDTSIEKLKSSGINLAETENRFFAKKLATLERVKNEVYAYPEKRKKMGHKFMQ